MANKVNTTLKGIESEVVVLNEELNRLNAKKEPLNVTEKEILAYIEHRFLEIEVFKAFLNYIAEQPLKVFEVEPHVEKTTHGLPLVIADIFIDSKQIKEQVIFDLVLGRDDGFNDATFEEFYVQQKNYLTSKIKDGKESGNNPLTKENLEHLQKQLNSLDTITEGFYVVAKQNLIDDIAKITKFIRL